MDLLVLLILVLASATLLFNVSRPFRQLRAQIASMREGDRFDASRIDSRYLEFRALAETLEETSDALRRRAEELRVQTDARSPPRSTRPTSWPRCRTSCGRRSTRSSASPIC